MATTNINNDNCALKSIQVFSQANIMRAYNYDARNLNQKLQHLRELTDLLPFDHFQRHQLDTIDYGDFPIAKDEHMEILSLQHGYLPYSTDRELDLMLEERVSYDATYLQQLKPDTLIIVNYADSFDREINLSRKWVVKIEFAALFYVLEQEGYSPNLRGLAEAYEDIMGGPRKTKREVLNIMKWGLSHVQKYHYEVHPYDRTKPVGHYNRPHWETDVRQKPFSLRTMIMVADVVCNNVHNIDTALIIQSLGYYLDYHHDLAIEHVNISCERLSDQCLGMVRRAKFLQRISFTSIFECGLYCVGTQNDFATFTKNESAWIEAAVLIMSYSNEPTFIMGQKASIVKLMSRLDEFADEIVTNEFYNNISFEKAKNVTPGSLIKLLLLCAGIEQNPGPQRFTKYYEGDVKFHEKDYIQPTDFLNARSRSKQASREGLGKLSINLALYESTKKPTEQHTVKFTHLNSKCISIPASVALNEPFYVLNYLYNSQLWETSKAIKTPSINIYEMVLSNCLTNRLFRHLYDAAGHWWNPVVYMGRNQIYMTESMKVDTVVKQRKLDAYRGDFEGLNGLFSVVESKKTVDCHFFKQGDVNSKFVAFFKRFDAFATHKKMTRLSKREEQCMERYGYARYPMPSVGPEDVTWYNVRLSAKPNSEKTKLMRLIHSYAYWYGVMNEKYEPTWADYSAIVEHVCRASGKETMFAGIKSKIQSVFQPTAATVASAVHSLDSTLRISELSGKALEVLTLVKDSVTQNKVVSTLAAIAPKGAPYLIGGQMMAMFDEYANEKIQSLVNYLFPNVEVDPIDLRDLFYQVMIYRAISHNHGMRTIVAGQIFNTLGLWSIIKQAFSSVTKETADEGGMLDKLCGGMKWLFAKPYELITAILRLLGKGVKELPSYAQVGAMLAACAIPFRSIKTMVDGMFSIGKILESVYSIYYCVKMWVSKKFGLDWDIPLQYRLHSNVEEWCEAATTLCAQKNRGYLMGVADRTSIFDDMLRLGNRYIMIAGKSGQSKLTTMIHPIMRDLGSVRKLLTLVQDPDSPRIKPYVVMLYGPPNIGKTVLVDSFIDGLKKTFQNDLTVYRWNSMTEWWDGYRQGINVLVMDDVCATKNPDHQAQLLGVINTMVANVPVACNENRPTLCDSPIIICTSNTKYSEATGLVNNEAIDRRFEYKYEVCPDPAKDVCTQSGVIIPAQAAAKGWDVLRYRRIPAIRNGKVMIDNVELNEGPWITERAKFINHLINEFRTHSRGAMGMLRNAKSQAQINAIVESQRKDIDELIDVVKLVDAELRREVPLHSVLAMYKDLPSTHDRYLQKLDELLNEHNEPLSTTTAVGGETARNPDELKLVAWLGDGEVKLVKQCNIKFSHTGDDNEFLINIMSLGKPTLINVRNIRNGHARMSALKRICPDATLVFRFLNVTGLNFDAEGNPFNAVEAGNNICELRDEVELGAFENNVDEVELIKRHAEFIPNDMTLFYTGEKYNSEVPATDNEVFPTYEIAGIDHKFSIAFLNSLFIVDNSLYTVPTLGGVIKPLHPHKSIKPYADWMNNVQIRGDVTAWWNLSPFKQRLLLAHLHEIHNISVGLQTVNLTMNTDFSKATKWLAGTAVAFLVYMTINKIISFVHRSTGQASNETSSYKALGIGKGMSHVTQAARCQETAKITQLYGGEHQLIKQQTFNVKIGPDRMECQAVGLREQFYLLPGHVVRAIMANNPHNVSVQFFSKRREAWLTYLVPIEDFAVHESKDIAVFRCNGRNAVSNIVKHIPEEDLVREGMNTILYAREQDTLYQKESHFTRFVNSYTGIQHTYTSGCEFAGAANPGTSGGPWVVVGTTPTTKFIAIQSVSGRMVTYGALLIRKEVVSLIDSLTTEYVPTVVSNHEILQETFKYPEVGILVKPTHMPNNTNIKKTVLYGALGVTENIPVLERHGENFLQQIQVKTSLTEILPLDDDILTSVTNDYAGHLLQILDRSHHRTPRVLSIETAILGDVEDGSKMDLTSSPGTGMYHWSDIRQRKGKRDFIDINEQGELIHLDGRVVEAVDKIFTDVEKKNPIVESTYTQFIKDEILPPTKAARGIDGSPLEQQIVYRMLNYDMDSMLKRHAGYETHTSVGIDLTSQEGQQLAQSLHPTRNIIYDVSKWDGSMNMQLMLKSADLRNIVCGYHPVRRHLINLVVNATILSGSKLLQPYKGMRSGYGGTAADNTFAHAILFAYMVYKLLIRAKKNGTIPFKHRLYKISYRMINGIVSWTMYGDDLMATLHDHDYEDIINGVTISEELEKYGFIIKNPDGKNSVPDRFTERSRVTFLKHTPVYNDTFGIYGWRIHFNSIIDATNWSMSSDIRESLDSLLLMLWQHGEEVYEKSRKLINLRLQTANCNLVMHLNYKEAWLKYFKFKYFPSLPPGYAQLELDIFDD